MLYHSIVLAFTSLPLCGLGGFYLFNDDVEEVMLLNTGSLLRDFFEDTFDSKTSGFKICSISK